MSAQLANTDIEYIVVQTSPVEQTVLQLQPIITREALVLELTPHMCFRVNTHMVTVRGDVSFLQRQKQSSISSIR